VISENPEQVAGLNGNFKWLWIQCFSRSCFRCCKQRPNKKRHAQYSRAKKLHLARTIETLGRISIDGKGSGESLSPGCKDRLATVCRTCLVTQLARRDSRTYRERRHPAESKKNTNKFRATAFDRESD